MFVRSLSIVLLLAVPVIACGKKKDDDAKASAAVAPRETAPPATAAATGAPPARSAAVTVTPPPGAPPADGKYERVQINGVTVPMIQVMNGGSVILVDTDGKKPRTWEEQYKRKRASLSNGQYDLHKTDVNKNDNFEDDAIDREGLWIVDAKGNITQH